MNTSGGDRRVLRPRPWGLARVRQIGDARPLGKQSDHQVR